MCFCVDRENAARDFLRTGAIKLIKEAKGCSLPEKHAPKLFSLRRNKYPSVSTGYDHL